MKDLTNTIDLLQQASAYIQASVKTQPGADGEPEPASENDHKAHDLACALSHEAARIRSATEAKASDLTARILQTIARQIDIAPGGQLQREQTFVGDLGCDSLDIVEMVMDLEDEFAIEVPDEDAEKITTVGDAIDYVAKKVEQAAAK